MASPLSSFAEKHEKLKKQDEHKTKYLARIKALFNHRGYDVCWVSPTGIILLNFFKPPVVATLQPGATKREALRASLKQLF